MRAAIVTALAVLLTLPACGDTSEREDVPGPAEAGSDVPGQTSSPRPVQVAITIDDLPWVGPLPPGFDRAEATDSILAALEAHDAQATGFVNCGRVQPGAPVLRQWLEAGHRLGNHTGQHLDLNDADTAAWVADARTCDTFLRELTGEDALYFRYPYLHRGPTAERYQAGRTVLQALGSPIAPVTIDTGDWIMDDAYVAALRAGEPGRAERIAGAYLDHVSRAAEHYREVAEERLGRPARHVLLLHANSLLATHLEPLLSRLEQDGFTLVPLDVALRDPLYDLDDDYLGPDGLSWLYRIPPATPESQSWDEEEAADLRQLIR